MSDLKHLDEIIEEQEALEDEESFLRPKPPSDDEMDITPMIDVTFLLLIFFLVTSTPDETTAVNLPNAQNGAPVSQIYSTVFTIGEGDRNGAPVYNADGTVEAFRLSDDDDKRKKEIKAAIEEGIQENSKFDIIIKADKAVKCREVDKVIKAASKVDGIKLHLAILSDN